MQLLLYPFERGIRVLLPLWRRDSTLHMILCSHMFRIPPQHLFLKIIEKQLCSARGKERAYNRMTVSQRCTRLLLHVFCTEITYMLAAVYQSLPVAVQQHISFKGGSKVYSGMVTSKFKNMVLTSSAFWSQGPMGNGDGCKAIFSQCATSTYHAIPAHAVNSRCCKNGSAYQIRNGRASLGLNSESSPK